MAPVLTGKLMGFVSEMLMEIEIAVEMKAGHWKAEVVTGSEKEKTGQSVVVIAVEIHGWEKYCQNCFGSRWCCRFHWSHRCQLQQDHPPAERLSTPAWWDAVCISSFSEHIGCKGISYRTWSSSLHSCYRQWVCGRLTWVLSLAVEDLLRCFGYGRGLCNASAKGLCGHVSSSIFDKSTGKEHGWEDVPSSEAHMAGKALEWLYIGVCSSKSG